MQLQTSKSSDDLYTMNVSLANRSCVSFIWNPTWLNLVTITDQDSTCFTPCCWFFCETGKSNLSSVESFQLFHRLFLVPTFQQLGCNQTLTRNDGVVASTTNSSSIHDCTKACAQFVWCAGVNYNIKNQTCEILTENTQTQNLTCDDSQDWLYFERKT